MLDQAPAPGLKPKAAESRRTTLANFSRCMGDIWNWNGFLGCKKRN